MDPTQLFIGMIFGAIGVGFFIYGKKQRKPIPLIVGIVLCAYPYFVTNIFALIAIGVVLTLIPYFI